MTCTRFSLNSINRSVYGASPHNSHRSSASGPSWSTSYLRPLLYVHPLVEFLNTPLPGADSGHESASISRPKTRALRQFYKVETNLISFHIDILKYKYC